MFSKVYQSVEELMTLAEFRNTDDYQNVYRKQLESMLPTSSSTKLALKPIKPALKNPIPAPRAKRFTPKKPAPAPRPKK